MTSLGTALRPIAVVDAELAELCAELEGALGDIRPELDEEPRQPFTRNRALFGGGDAIEDRLDTLADRAMAVHRTIREKASIVVERSFDGTARKDFLSRINPRFGIAGGRGRARVRMAAHDMESMREDLAFIRMRLQHFDYIEPVKRRPSGETGAPDAQRLAAESPIDALLVVVTDKELAALRRAVASAMGREMPVAIRHGPRRSYDDLGTIGGARVYALQVSMGSGTPGGSLASIMTALDEVKPRSVVMLGIAFGVDETKQKIGDVIIAKQMHSYEPSRVGTSKAGEEEVVPRGSVADASTRLLSRFQTTASFADRFGLTVKAGLLLSGEKLVDNIAFRNRVLAAVPEALGGEMEGSGLYVACHEHGRDWIIVKAICDFADGNKATDKDARQAKAAESAAALVVRTLLAGGLAPDAEVAKK
jgi:nucleoside phosphorylase